MITDLINPISIPSVWFDNDFKFPTIEEFRTPEFEFQDGKYSLVTKVDSKVSPSDVEITVEDNILSIHTEWKDEHSKSSTLCTYTIPKGADASEINAELTDDGLLIIMPEL